MFPVSGALQLHASGASCGLRPMISASGAYSIGQPRPPLWVRVEQIPQTPATRLTFEVLDDLRVISRGPDSRIWISYTSSDG